MDKLIGFVCALLCAWNADAAVTGWAGTSQKGAMTNTGTALAGTATITLHSAPVVGSILFSVTATAGSAIAAYAFDTDGNPSTTGAIAKVGTAGVVTLATAINYPTVKQVIFKIKATDSETVPTTGVMTVTVNFAASSNAAVSFCAADPTAIGTVIGKPTSASSTAVWTITAGSDQASFSIADGSVKAAVKLESSVKTYYTATLTLTDGTEITTWPMHVVLGNCMSVSSGVAQIVSGGFTIMMTVLACYLL